MDHPSWCDMQEQVRDSNGAPAGQLPVHVDGRYEASDRTSLRMQYFSRCQKDSCIFCSFSAAQVVQDNLSDVLKSRTLQGAAEVLVAKSEAPSALFPGFSIWGRVKQRILQKKNVEEAKEWLREQNFFVSAYAGQLPLCDQAGCTRNKRDVLKEFLAKGLQSVGALCAKNIFRIYTRARVPKVLLKEDSLVPDWAWGPQVLEARS